VPRRSGVEELHPRADGDQIRGNVEAVRHYEGDEEHCEDRSTGPVESPDVGECTEPSVVDDDPAPSSGVVAIR